MFWNSKLQKINTVELLYSPFKFVCGLAYNYTHIKQQKNLKFFSTEKELFTRDLSAGHIRVFMFYLEAKDIMDSLNEVKKLEDKYRSTELVEQEDDISMFGLKKKFLLKVDSVESGLGDVIAGLDNLIMVLVRKPEWATDDDLTEFIEELRRIISIFFFCGGALEACGKAVFGPRIQFNRFSLAQQGVRILFGG